MIRLARWLSFLLQTDGLWVQILIQSLQLQLSRLFQATNLLRFKLLNIHSIQVCKQVVAITAPFSLVFPATSGVKHLQNYSFNILLFLPNVTQNLRLKSEISVRRTTSCIYTQEINFIGGSLKQYISSHQQINKV